VGGMGGGKKLMDTYHAMIETANICFQKLGEEKKNQIINSLRERDLDINVSRGSFGGSVGALCFFNIFTGVSKSMKKTNHCHLL
jgi:hypothetical protein